MIGSTTAECSGCTILAFASTCDWTRGSIRHCGVVPNVPTIVVAMETNVSYYRYRSSCLILVQPAQKRRVCSLIGRDRVIKNKSIDALR